MVRADRFIDRVYKPAFIKSIKICVKKNFLAWRAFHVTRGLDADFSFGQRAGFIGAYHVHAAEVFDRSEAFDDDFFLGHALCAMGKVDADDRGQKLRGQPHGQRQGKKHRFQDGTRQIHIYGKNGHHQHQRYFQEEIAE